jgi:hypothetical protein
VSLLWPGLLLLLPKLFCEARQRLTQFFWPSKVFDVEYSRLDAVSVVAILEWREQAALVADHALPFGTRAAVVGVI